MNKEINDNKIYTNGISFVETDIRFSGLGGKNHPVLSYFFGVIINLLLTFGALFTAALMFNIEFNYYVISAAIVFCNVVFPLIFLLDRKIKIYISIGLFAIVLAVCALFYGRIVDGAVNSFLYAKDAIFDSMYWTKNATVDFKSLDAASTTFFLTVVSVVLSYFVCAFNSKKVNFIGLFLVTFPFFEIGAAFGVVPDYLAFALLLSGWTSSFALFITTFIKKKKGQKKKKTLKKTSLISMVSVFVAILTLAAFLGVNTLLSYGGYNRPDGVKDLRIAIKEGYSNIYDLITGEDHDASLKEGKLYKLSDRIVKNRRYMTIKTNGVDAEAGMYFRGYIGSRYTGSEWQDFSDSVYSDYSTMFGNFENNSFYPQQFIGAMLNEIYTTGRDSYLGVTAKTVEISNLRRKKAYAYTLDNTYFSDNYKYKYDTSIIPSSRSRYSYTTFLNSMNYIKVTSSDIWLDSNYQALLTQYDNFVKANYLQMPKGTENLAKIVSGIKKTAGDNFEIADYIRYYLKDHTKVSNKYPQLPDGAEFINYFLSESKKGHSAHYATASTILLRAAGVPARYCEGFLINAETLDGVTPDSNGNYKIDVTDNESHAWVEIFNRNYGWLPVEVTPGYYTGHLNKPQQNNTSSTSPSEYEIDPNDDNVIILPPPDTEQESAPETFFEKVSKWFKNNFVKLLLRILYVIALMLSVAAIAVLVLVLRMLIKRNIRKKRINQSNTSVSAIEVYKYFCALLRFLNIENTENLPYLSFVKQAAQKASVIDKEKADYSMNVFLKAAFSEKKVEEQELSFARIFVENTARGIYKNSSFLNKFKFVLVKCLL